MADNADDIRANLEKQIGDLKREIAKISRSLASRASDAVDEAEEAYDDHRGRARHMVRHAREQAHAVAEVARENPGTTATVLTSVGLLGLTVGMVLGGIFTSNSRR
ncbi:hypothetical protein PE067_06510 [Paracoccus sp. DMF-8]|uniref:hypothetical protein n=1 Tax=Paracoccus sp. DMF-8 TaxID=3019445 RepID=UPI0023E8AD87|nr:hypothetical protein [Paracoccus sp. DMF-8]MDF3605828.1 hypothetical protein [Paracoccus sp. DMF-8]